MPDQSIATELHDHVDAYLHGNLNLAQFANWFSATVLGPIEERTDDPALRRRVYGIELCLAEYDHKDWTEDELRTRLGEVVGLPAPVRS